MVEYDYACVLSTNVFIASPTAFQVLSAAGATTPAARASLPSMRSVLLTVLPAGASCFSHMLTLNACALADVRAHSFSTVGGGFGNTAKGSCVLCVSTARD